MIDTSKGGNNVDNANNIMFGAIDNANPEGQSLEEREAIANKHIGIFHKAIDKLD